MIHISTSTLLEYSLLHRKFFFFAVDMVKDGGGNDIQEALHHNDFSRK